MAKRLRVFNTYQAASIVTEFGYKKIRPLQTQSGEYRYQMKGLTDAEYSITEDMTPQEVENLTEAGGWMLLDAFTASAVKQLYEALSEKAQASFDKVPMVKLAGLAFQHSV